MGRIMRSLGPGAHNHQYSRGTQIRFFDLEGGVGGLEVSWLSNLWKVRSRPSQRRFLQPHIHFAAFFEIYEIDTLLHTAPTLKFTVFISCP